MTKAAKWDAPIVPELKSERVYHFRQRYRAFRTGAPQGAKGEALNAFFVEPEVPEIDEGAIKQETFYSLDGSKEQKVFDAITSYRISYLRFRQGAHHGAKGEVSTVANIMTQSHARFMPVGQRAALIRAGREAAGERPKTRFHVHWGCGRLALSLVIPAVIRGDAPFALVDGPFGDYADLLKRNPETVDLYINDKVEIKGLKLISKKEQLPANLQDPSNRLFVLSTDEELVRVLVAAADTFSTALGPIMPKVLMPYFGRAPEAEQPVKNIFCCENDHGMVEELHETLRGKAEVVTCMVDRISTGRDVVGNEIRGSAEPYDGMIVVLDPPKAIPLAPFTGKNVLVPSSYGEAHYFTRRKITIVNGMHTTLAFMTLCKEEKGSDAGSHELMTYGGASKEEREMIYVWLVARLLLVLWEHDLETIKHAHGVEKDEEVCTILLEYGKGTLDRFDTIKDKTDRVLGGGVANRWATRLKVVQDFLSSQRSFGGISSRLLRMAGVKESEIREKVTKLVSDSERFVGSTPNTSV